MSAQVAGAPPVAEPLRRSHGEPDRPGRARRLARLAQKYAVGVLLTQALPLSVLVVGWTYRLMRRVTLQEWWRWAGAPGGDFATFARQYAPLRAHARLPNWLLDPEPRRVVAAGGRRRLPRALLGGLRENLTVGVRAILNTWVLTLPGCVLWLFAWYSGWDNSFNKGYEQFWVGPATGLLGVGAFIAAMLYLPLAQARQAATGDWRAFYEFGLVRALARHRWRACLLLAALYALVSLPLTVLETFPALWGQANPAIHDLTDAQVLALLRRYYLVVGLLGFPAYVLLRVYAARIYARAVVSAVRAGVVRPEQLRVEERRTLERLGLLARAPERDRHPIVRAIGWTGGRALRTAGAAAVAVAWFAFVAQIFVSEFLNYHPVSGWLNQPLVQLPAFVHIPPHLRP